MATSLTLSLSVLLGSCRSKSTEQTGQSSAQVISAETDAGFGTTVAQSQEPSGAFANPRAFVIGFNTPGSYGWAVSNDFGVTFNRECDFLGVNLLGDAGLPCAPVPFPPPSSHIGTTTDGGEDWTWGGNATVVADGQGNLAFVGLGGQGGGPGGQFGTNLLFVSISQNGGADFDSTTIVNDTGCSNGLQDQPNAVFDVTTNPPTLWVVWRHSGLGTLGIAGACIRRGIIVKDNVDGGGSIARVRWLDDPRTVDGLGGIYQDGVAVAAGDGVVTVMYGASTTYLPGAGPLNTHPAELCPDNGGLFSMDFATVDSFDNGHNWVDNIQMFHTQKFQWCVIGGPPNVPGQGTVLTSIRAFELTRAPGGIEYGIVQDSRNTARLFMSPAAGIKGYQNQFSTIRTWFEWCPGTPTSTVDGGPTWNWSSTTCATPAISSDPTNIGLDLTFVTIASDGRGNIAIGDMEQATNGSGPAAPPVTVNYAMRSIVNPQRPGAVMQGPVFITPTPQTIMSNSATAFSPRPYGDYGWIATRPSGSFSPFIQPGCTEANDFFPMFTGNNGGGLPDVVVRGFSVTP